MPAPCCVPFGGGLADVRDCAVGNAGGRGAGVAINHHVGVVGTMNIGGIDGGVYLGDVYANVAAGRVHISRNRVGRVDNRGGHVNAVAEKSGLRAGGGKR